MDVVITSGDLKHTVVFKQPTSSLNDEGETVKSFADFYTCKAARLNFRDSRVTQAEQVSLIGAFDFYVRYCTSTQLVSKDFLISHEGKDFTIFNIDRNALYKEFIVFTAKVKE